MHHSLNSKTRVLFLAAATAGLLASGAATMAADWPMFGRDRTRNPVSPERNAPISWDIQTGRNIHWKARIGRYDNFATPVVANGLVWIGTNNGNPRDAGIKEPAGVLMCFRESDGQFLYQHVSPARQGPIFNQAHTGVSCSPLIEGDRLWFVTTGQEVVCLDVGPLRRGEGLPKQVWKLDMMDELGVYARRAIMGGGNLCSITSRGDQIYVTTGNGTDGWNDKSVPSPFAPALLCLNKNTGALVWEDHSSGAGILFAEWGNPLVIDVNGRAQVIAPQGDGWVRSFDALTGELIWKFDINPKSGKWPQTRGFFSTAPVFSGNRVYIAIGNYIGFGEMHSGRLVCLNPTKEGDISLELEDGSGNGRPNPNSGAAWHFDGMARTLSSVAVHDGLVIAPDFAGFVHCLEAETGQTHWKHNLRGRVINSPLVVDGKIYVGDEDGDLCVLALSSEKRVLAENAFEGSILSAPIFANERLYVVAGDTLFAIRKDGGKDWPQWRGPDRSNASLETGLLQQWPTNGPPLLWKATGLGTGIASVSVAEGQVYTMGYRDGAEFVFALEAGTGAERWVSRVGAEVKENPLMRWMTQRTPTVDEDRVYTMSASGELICLRTMDGRQLWRKSYPNEFLSPRRIWGFSDYPLVDGENLICTPVGPDATVVALNKRTGEVKWKAHLPGENAGYAATVISEGGGIPHYVVFLARSLVGINTRNGTVLWQYARPTTRIASSYSPIVHGEFVFSPNGYAGGMALLKLVRDGDGISAQEQYHRKFNFNAFQDCTTRVGDHVYSFQSPGQPVCINLNSGELAWGPAPGPGRDRATLTSADGHLYIRRSSGAMILAEANPAGYVEKGSFQIPDREEASGVTSPVVAGGRLYLRDNNQLFSYDVSANALQKPASEPRIAVLSVPSAEVQTVVTTPGRTGRDRAPDAIFVPTPEDIVEKMLELASLKKEDTVYALGSGDGRIVIAAAAKYGCQAVGYEIDPRLVELSRERVAEGKVESLVRIEHEDMFTRDLGGADVVVTYLPSPLMERLLPQFEKLKPGSRIVSHQFEIPGVRPGKSVTFRSNVDGDQHRLFLWTTPLLKSP